jgi:hypothetical protein
MRQVTVNYNLHESLLTKRWMVYTSNTKPLVTFDAIAMSLYRSILHFVRFARFFSWSFHVGSVECGRFLVVGEKDIDVSLVWYYQLQTFTDTYFCHSYKIIANAYNKRILPFCHSSIAEVWIILYGDYSMTKTGSNIDCNPMVLCIIKL